MRSPKSGASGRGGEIGFISPTSHGPVKLASDALSPDLEMTKAEVEVRKALIMARLEAGERRADVARDLGISIQRVAQIIRPRRQPTDGAEPSDRERASTRFPRTPDGRYFVVRGQLWRLSNPALAEEVAQNSCAN